MGKKRFFLLILHLAVPYWYLSRYFLLRACRADRDNLAALVESGFFHPALRILSSEERLSVSVAYKRGKKIPQPENPEFALNDGYRKIGNLASAVECDSVVEYLKKEKGYLGQVPLQSSGMLYSYDEARQAPGARGRYFSFAPGTSLKNPVIGRLIDDARIKDVVHANLGREAILNGVNTFVVFPGEAPDHYVMKTHRDYDDFNFIAFFIYWTSVTADNGATIYIPGTHVSSDIKLMKNRVFLEGGPGDVFALDSFGYHSGNSHVKTPRFVTWLRYGLENNLSVADGWPLSKVMRRMHLAGAE